MRTLQDDALLAATSHIPNLKSLLNFCAENPRIGDSCDKSGYFWRESLIRLFGKTIVLQRGDLTIEDWPIFAKILATGRTFQYVVSYDSLNNTWMNPESYYAVEHIDNDIYHYELKIPAAVPVAGAQGYFVRLSFDGSRTKEVTEFFVGPDMEQNSKFASEWVAITYINYHSLTIGINAMDFFSNAYYREDAGLREKIPSPQTLVDLIVNRPHDANGVKSDVWFAHYGYFDNSPHAWNSYSETNYDIVPITF